MFTYISMGFFAKIVCQICLMYNSNDLPRAYLIMAFSDSAKNPNKVKN